MKIKFNKNKTNFEYNHNNAYCIFILYETG